MGEGSEDVHFFFFQAEDGIRDAQESRGLGDVYKRQIYGTTSRSEGETYPQVKVSSSPMMMPPMMAPPMPVSYTHLTLPTIYSV